MNDVVDTSKTASGYTIKTATDRYGNADKAMEFTEDKEYVLLDNGVLNGYTDFTISFWARITSYESYTCYLSGRASSKTYDELLFCFHYFILCESPSVFPNNI